MRFDKVFSGKFRQKKYCVVVYATFAVKKISGTNLMRFFANQTKQSDNSRKKYAS